MEKSGSGDTKSGLKFLDQTGVDVTEVNGNELSVGSNDVLISNQDSDIDIINIDALDNECDEDLDVREVDSAMDPGPSLLLDNQWHEICTNENVTKRCTEEKCEPLDVVKTDSSCGIDQLPGLSCGKPETFLQAAEKITSPGFQGAEKTVDGLGNDLSSVYNFKLSDPMPYGNEDDDETADYNQFYFESDHLALKNNKHYHILLQTLLVLESQRTQAVKDLETLYQQQAKALQDPVAFVEKLQNNEPLNLPCRQRIVKLPSIPWEEYTVSLSAMDRQRLSNPHHTRASATQNVARASDLSSNASDGVENTSVSSDSNVYSVFGGEFVASKRGKPLERDSLTSVFSTKSSEGRSRQCNEAKPVTFNQPWTTEEQAKLEKLLQIYPQEEVESKRWEKIANALGNRTLKQVASRVQKYFIKLAKSGLPVPGRMPNLPRPGMRSKRSSHHYQTLGFRNSTFFPSYRPKVLMDEDDDTSSIATDDTAGYASEEESIPLHLRDTDEYRELMELKRLKRQKIAEQAEEGVLHNGFMCDGCGTSPILGTRWHCNDCSKDNSVDFCTACVERGNTNIGSHTSEHSLEAVNRNSSFFVDGDYVGLSEGSTSAGYNYLDPNFLPTAR